MGKSYRMQIIFGVVTLLAVIVAFSSATFAWFTFSSDTNVEPLEGGIGSGDGNLLIANAPEGPFSDSCELNAFGDDTLLRPLSTADLSTFYAAREQNRSGISIGFARVSRIFFDRPLCSACSKSSPSDSLSESISSSSACSTAPSCSGRLHGSGASRKPCKSAGKWNRRPSMQE